jgi:hypothetical protein
VRVSRLIGRVLSAVTLTCADAAHRGADLRFHDWQSLVGIDAARTSCGLAADQWDGECRVTDAREATSSASTALSLREDVTTARNGPRRFVEYAYCEPARGKPFWGSLPGNGLLTFWFYDQRRSTDSP